MSHHIVTVCVVCVLCAAHVPCSAHTNPSATLATLVHSYSNSTNTGDPSDPSAQPFPSTPISFRDPTRPYSNFVSNKHKLSASRDAHPAKKDTTESFKSGGKTRSTTSSSSSIGSGSSRDAELLERLAQTKLEQFSTKQNSSVDLDTDYKARLKRDVTVVDETYFMRKIFEAYGDGTSITMDGFEKLVRKLGLLKLLTEASGVESGGTERSNGKSYSNNGLHDADSKNSKERCLNSQELLSTVAQDMHYISDNNTTTMPSWLFERVCPALVYQLAAESSSERNGCIRVPENYKPVVSSDKFYTEDSVRNTVKGRSKSDHFRYFLQIKTPGSSPRLCQIVMSESINNCKMIVIPAYVIMTAHAQRLDRLGLILQLLIWVYSTASIFVISLSGLLGVAVIPVMKKNYYHHVLQFLVALAVGTLTGDALIHLLPHAMMPPHHHEHGEHHEHHHEHHHNESNSTLLINHMEQHTSNMWKGLVAMMGFVFFFFTEKLLITLTEWRKHRQRRSKLPTRVRVMRESDGANSNVVGEKLCKHKYSSYPYCYGEIASETQDNHHNRQISHHERPPIIEEEKPLTSNCNSITKIVSNEKEKKDDWRLDDSAVGNAKKNGADGANASLNESESYTVIIREHETKHHGHSHSHGHVHSAPESMSSVVWMVVLGDGLHNFTDGMAIGAAFSANIAGGFSTAIAVLCHELPHEIGDFAVLLRAGMSTKQAVFYNLLSSVLCLFGMIVGVSLGNTPDATSWMFAAAAGIFLYIALVDMIPELSSSHSAENGSRWQCIWQGLGLLTGLGIMLLIAAYEHDLKHIFDN